MAWSEALNRTLASAMLRDSFAESGWRTLRVYCLESMRVGPKFFSFAVAFTVKVDEPVAVGVPEIVPAGRERQPGGSAPRGHLPGHVRREAGALERGRVRRADRRRA